MPHSHFEAYIDESGNTGLDLFGDKEQPFFWTGTIVVEEKISLPYDVYELAQSEGKKELHGNELGLGRIDRLADRLIQIIEGIDARFHFTRTEKKHIPTMRFADAILDNVNNAAVGHMHYQVTFLRKALAARIDAFFSEQDKIEFWNIHLSGNVNEFQQFLRKFRTKISTRYPSNDRRGKSILLDAIEWGIRHPDVLLTERTQRPEGVEDFRSLQYESPNLVSVSMLLSGLHNLGENHNKKVKRIVHDEQSEFGQYLQQMYRYFKGVKIRDDLQLFPIVEGTDMFPDALEFGSSSSSPYLQLVDVCLWLLKQKVDLKKEIYGRAGELLDTVIKRSSINHFSSSFLQAEVQYFTQLLMNAPISEAQLIKAQKQIAELEEQRKKRLENNW
ncbi:DUF3800 domain-containing protein [Paenibacillus validus]|uniref:DUF3800 domain-containing protein n=1 Tax=Paenibacillus validus TaxID=44253 RepID=A0A7X2ZAM8_9BACL|nr:DUF3800 domain-containing protein [Paenibacillus validus]MUG71331.1 hypothetical protein [Paenibacillus validus]